MAWLVFWLGRLVLMVVDANGWIIRLTFLFGGFGGVVWALAYVIIVVWRWRTFGVVAVWMLQSKQWRHGEFHICFFFFYRHNSGW